MKNNFTEEDISRIIEMAWEDRTPFDAIESHNLKEDKLKLLMKKNLKLNSYKLWRKRMKNSNLRHESLRSDEVTRAYCPQQHKHKK